MTFSKNNQKIGTQIHICMYIDTHIQCGPLRIEVVVDDFPQIKMKGHFN